MKGSNVLRAGVITAAMAMAAAGFAQGPPSGPGGPGGPGGQGWPGGSMGHRPPIERAFGGHGIEGRWWNNPRIAEQLKLTDDQRKQFDDILLQHRETLIDLHANLEKAELALEPLIGADQPNENGILAQIDKVAQARAELEKANARYLLAIRGKLTPEQWKQMQDFRKDHRSMRGDRSGRDGRGPRGQGGPGGSGNNPPPPGPPGPQGMADDGPSLAAPANGAGQN
ncbi:MAG: Spy/CpxP family protein refolding chaperone [Terracidiphilus sp.]